jgi:hypothetical protein
MKTLKRNLKKAVLTLSALVCMASAGWAQSPGAELADKRYKDPKGYFTIVPPAGWRIQEYPGDVRGKVAFIGTDGNTDCVRSVNPVSR